MARWFGRKAATSEMNAGATQWGRVVLVILGVLIVGGLVVGTFLYGSQQRGDEAPQPQQGEATQSPQEAASEAQRQENQESQSDDSAPQDSTGQPSTESNSQQIPGGGPATTPNTGPEDWVPFIATAVVLLGWYGYKSRERLSQAQRNL